MNTVAAEPIPAFLDKRPLIGTFTILSSFMNCEHAMYRRYIKKDQPYVETKEIKWGNDVHTAFERRCGRGLSLPETMRSWEPFAVPFDGRIPTVEQKLGITREGRPTGFYERDVWFRVKVDLTVISGNTAYLLDWKSGGSKFEDPFELEIGAMLLKAKRPQLEKIVGSYAWLKENRLSTLYDLSDFQATWTRVCSLMRRIEDKQHEGGEWVKRKSGL